MWGTWTYRAWNGEAYRSWSVRAAELCWPNWRQSRNICWEASHGTSCVRLFGKLYTDNPSCRIPKRKGYKTHRKLVVGRISQQTDARCSREFWGVWWRRAGLWCCVAVFVCPYNHRQRCALIRARKTEHRLSPWSVAAAVRRNATCDN